MSIDSEERPTIPTASCVEICDGNIYRAQEYLDAALVLRDAIPAQAA